MIQIGSSKLKQIMEALDGQTHDGVTFHVEGAPQGLSCKFSHNGESDTAAKAVVKKVVAGLPGCATAYLKVDLLDDQGRII